MYKKIITMTAWRRPEYTRQVIDNLKRCIGFEEYILLPTIEPGNQDVLKAFDGLSNCQIVVNDMILGCSPNTFKALHRGFDISDFVIHLEDDTVPGIDSLKYFEWIYKTYKDNKEIFTATTYNRIKDINPQNYFTAYRFQWFTGWMWCTWIDRFEEMKREWDFNTWDININHKIRKNRYEICPHLPRSQNIGEHLGTYNTPDFWRQNQYNSIWIDGISNISFGNLAYTELLDISDIRNYVTEGYRKILARDPDPGGFDHYISEISSGRMTRDMFLEILVTSEEHRTRFG